MRIFFLAFVFISICGIAAVEVGGTTPAKQQAVAVETTADEDNSPVLSKSDKLTASYIEAIAPETKAVRVVPITVPKVAQPAPPLQDKPPKIIGRHWHEGDNKIAKGTVRPRRDGPQAKGTEPRGESQSSPIETVRSWFAANKT